MSKITAERLRSLLFYNPETGTFIRRVSCRGRRANTLAGTIRYDGYVGIDVDRGHYLGHRLAWLYMTGEWPSAIDHKNTVRSDNRWHNLREATKSQNWSNRGRPANNTSGHKGVFWDGRANRWRAVVSVEKRRLYLGCFENFGDAVDARRAAAQMHYGEFVRHV